MLRLLTYRRYGAIDAMWLVFFWPVFSENAIAGISLAVGGIILSSALEVMYERRKK